MLTNLILAAALLGATPQMTEEVRDIVVQNRILTKVNGKNISVLDVVKQMDVYLSRYYPQYMTVKGARAQFYQSQWKQTLQQMIDNELMMADAESRELKVSDGEVREEIQNRFGPNVMGALDQLGISYEEARKMVHQDMIVQRVQWIRVTSKALQQITSKEIKEAYQRYLEEKPAKEEWKFQFLTIRADDADLLAEKATLLHESTLEATAEKLKKELPPDSAAQITISQEFVQEDRALSQSYRELLSSLKVGEWSRPVTQVSRDGATVVRIFHLKDHTKNNPPPFEAVAGELKEELLNTVASREMAAYQKKLRSRFGYDEKSLDLPVNFEPFAVR